MRKMTLSEIRKEFLEFFYEKNHTIKHSYSLIPKDDDSLLLIGAGMAPMKKYFTGEEIPENKRVATSQKCIRTGDIGNVGITDRHATFFEMLGNFSFGDYFKEEAILWAWEFMTKNLQVKEEDIWVTVYKDDDEAEKIWNEKIGINKEKIVRLGKEDNFWELEVGPSGPCSEIFIDRGPNYGCKDNTCKPGCDCDRFLEVWNLVFSQFDKQLDGSYVDLKHPGIDTGMGLERITAISQGVDSIFEIEELKKLIEEIEKLSNTKYGKNDKDDISIRIIIDHVRSMTFLISDGVRPGNESKEYVLRRIIRRAARHGKLLGIEKSFLYNLVDNIIEEWKDEYSDLEENREMIKKVIKDEEDRFQRTIDQGLDILNKYMIEMEENKQNTLDGKKAFKLYDTFGFPLDLTREILIEKDLNLDEKAFNKEMEAQRERARAARKNDNIGWATNTDTDLYEDLKTEFLGYDKLNTEAKILGIFSDSEKLETAQKDDEIILILDKTTFYAESGGQLGDFGIIESENGKVEILDTQKTNKDHKLHIGKVIEGKVNTGEKVSVKPNENRLFTTRNHTAAHLLYRALKDVLSEDVEQAGSEVGPNNLRFDFTWSKAVTDEELLEVENIVNKKIFEALDVKKETMAKDEATEKGAIGLFEDKYGDIVRVLSIGDYSIELCGGLHVDNTDEIGIFKIIDESSISARVRRIEAITSEKVYEYLKDQEKTLDKITELFRSDRKNIIEKINSVLNTQEKIEKELQDLQKEMAASKIDNLINEKIKVKDTFIISEKIENVDMNGLRQITDNLKSQLETCLIALAGIDNDKLYFVVSATEDLVKRGINSGDIVRQMAQLTGGSGGGRPQMAQAGGKDIEKVDESLELAKKLLEKNLK